MIKQFHNLTFKGVNSTPKYRKLITYMYKVNRVVNV